ncbi:MAG TPA: PAS domain S-box protein, partial [Thermoanaerobaculia bacterium]|nr:PAS domain S-box protein [Thermoanaerobaculia bacterium]
LFATIASELAFTLYTGVYDLPNMLGHVLKLGAFACLFAAIVNTGLRRPYELIFRDLEQSRRELEQAKCDLSAKVEEELRRSAAYTRSLIEASLDPLVTIGKDGTITDVNAATEEITGRKRCDLVGTDFSVYFTDPVRAREGYRLAFLSGQVRDYPLEILHNGSPVPVLYNATVYRGADGEVSGVFAAARDITMLRKAEQALRDGEERYRILVESVTDYIYTVRVEDRRPVSTEHGPGCVAVTGYHPEEYAADPFLWYRMIYEEDRPAVEAQAARILAGETVDPVEHRVRHKDGTLRWVRNTPVPRYDAQGALVSYDGLISDITERKRLEEQLIHSQRMEAIGRLAGGIAHDFNNILSAVIGYGQLISMKMRENDPLRENVQHLLDAADRAANLTHSLLAFSRKQIINPVDVELNEIIPRTGKFLRRIIGEDIDMQIVFRKERITVHADSGQLEQIFMNLATNARDAMQRGGRFVIEADTVELDEPFIRAHGYGRRGWFALVSVSDTGAGMDAAVQKRVFEP